MNHCSLLADIHSLLTTKGLSKQEREHFLTIELYNQTYANRIDIGRLIKDEQLSFQAASEQVMLCKMRVLLNLLRSGSYDALVSHYQAQADRIHPDPWLKEA